MRWSSIILTLTLSCSLCSCGGHQSVIEATSELFIEPLEYNFLPLSSCGVAAGLSGSSIYSYEFNSNDCLCNDSPKLVCTGEPESLSVSVNGNEVHSSPEQHLLGEDDKCYPLSGIVHEGLNRVVLTGKEQPLSVSLAGHFRVMPGGDGQWIVNPEEALELGSLPQQGLPFFRGCVSYSRQYEISGRIGLCVLRVPHWEGAGCEVWVNGIKIANFTRRSFKKNIGPALKQGTNYVELRISAYPPAGVSDIRDFGLIEDFTL